MINPENYKRVVENIQNAAKKAGRNKEDVTLTAVSKTFSLEDILEVHKLGQIDFGENYAQEFVNKYETNTLNDKIKWHYIGQLQSNKVKYIVNKISLVHTLDRISLAKELNKRYTQLNLSVDALVQVNIGNELQKGGIAVSEVEKFLDQLSVYDSVNVKGLMCIHPYGRPEDSRRYFAEMKNVFDGLKDKGYPLTELSMGMSSDYIEAIDEGATIVRVGSAIFGNR